jgi:hypothetical protein
MGGQSTSNLTPVDEEANPMGYEDYQDGAPFSGGSVPQPKARSEAADKLLASTNSFSNKKLHVTGNELRRQQDGLSGSEAYPPGETSPAHNYVKYHKDNQNHEFRPIWDHHYQEDDISTPAVGPGDGESASGNDGLNLHPFMNLGPYGWSLATSVAKGIQSSVMADQCYGLLVCEAHRVGRAWGDSWMLLASGLR